MASLFARQAVGVSLAICMLVGCGGSRMGLPLPGQEANDIGAQPVINGSYKTLYSFQGNTDGASPWGGSLVAVKGLLYGTTLSFPVAGTAFQVSTSGKERMLYAFQAGSDGAFPYSSLIALNGELYGTTTEGGGSRSCVYPIGYGCGTVFKLSASGQERVLYRFKGHTDGSYPFGGLIAVRGSLYGTTEYDGGSCAHTSGYLACGTVFEMSTSGKERVLHRFKGRSDGSMPGASLAVINDILYGTTSEGGSSLCGGTGCGTVFEISRSGKERVLYKFKGGRDGAYPIGTLLPLNGSLYGTTIWGGGSRSCNTSYSTGCGTVFSVSTSGTEHVLYGFKGGRDGFRPQAGLIAVNGTLYGTTNFGGSGACKDPRFAGCGTIFKMSATGAKTILYNFRPPPDGSEPRARLTLVKGELYGTTTYGGSNCPYLAPPGCGTVFQISP